MGCSGRSSETLGKPLGDAFGVLGLCDAFGVVGLGLGPRGRQAGAGVVFQNVRDHA
jgi:hypothetical protein